MDLAYAMPGDEVSDRAACPAGPRLTRGSGPLSAGRAGTPFGRERPLGRLEYERLWRLPDTPGLECPRVGHGPVANEIKQAGTASS